MTIISVFAFDNQIACQYCADRNHKSAWKNDRILLWIIIGWISIVLHVITSYFVSNMIRFDYDFRLRKGIEQLKETIA